MDVVAGSSGKSSGETSSPQSSCVSSSGMMSCVGFGCGL